MKNKSLIMAVIAVLIVGAGAFFGGMKYQQSKEPAFLRQGGVQGTRGGGNRTAGGAGFRPLSGQIIAADDKSITVKLSDGSSKIVIYSDSTKVNKTSEGSKEDLKVGEQAMVVGTESTDGTVTAQSISIGGNILQGMPSGQPPDQNN